MKVPYYEKKAYGPRRAGSAPFPLLRIWSTTRWEGAVYRITNKRTSLLRKKGRPYYGALGARRFSYTNMVHGALGARRFPYYE